MLGQSQARETRQIFPPGCRVRWGRDPSGSRNVLWVRSQGRVATPEPTSQTSQSLQAPLPQEHIFASLVSEWKLGTLLRAVTLFCQGIIRGLFKGRGVLRTLSLYCLPTLSQSQTLHTTFVAVAFLTCVELLVSDLKPSLSCLNTCLLFPLSS